MVSSQFRLRFPKDEIRRWASLYDYPGEVELIRGPVATARKSGYLTAETFVAIGEWKSPRARKRAANASIFIEEVTRLALSPKTSPRLAIEALTLLSGVSWPTASVILHFCHPDPYPIVDYRALWSVSSAVPSQYGYAFWDEYTSFTRNLAKGARVDMRTLDRALWKYSELHQPALAIRQPSRRGVP
jgi:hypothetical protein